MPPQPARTTSSHLCGSKLLLPLIRPEGPGLLPALRLLISPCPLLLGIATHWLLLLILIATTWPLLDRSKRLPLLLLLLLPVLPLLLPVRLLLLPVRLLLLPILPLLLRLLPELLRLLPLLSLLRRTPRALLEPANLVRQRFLALLLRPAPRPALLCLVGSAHCRRGALRRVQLRTDAGRRSRGALGERKLRLVPGMLAGRRSCRLACRLQLGIHLPPDQARPPDARPRPARDATGSERDDHSRGQKGADASSFYESSGREREIFGAASTVDCGGRKAQGQPRRVF